MEKLHLKGLLCWIPRARVVTIVARLMIFLKITSGYVFCNFLAPTRVINNQYQVFIII
jgi:hypothetical protein